MKKDLTLYSSRQVASMKNQLKEQLLKDVAYKQAQAYKKLDDENTKTYLRKILLDEVAHIQRVKNILACYERLLEEYDNQYTLAVDHATSCQEDMAFYQKQIETLLNI